MAPLGINGGLIGPARTPNPQTSVPGVYTIEEQMYWLRRDLWPRSGDRLWSNVSLLMPMEGSNGSTTFTTLGNTTQTITRVGSPLPTISTAQSPNGISSAEFTTNGQYIYISDNSAITFGTGDFTAEAWAYPLNPGTNPYGIAERTIMGLWSAVNPSAQAWFIALDGARIYVMSDVLTNDRVLFNISGVFTTAKWYHVAWSRIGPDFLLHIDGAFRGSHTVGAGAAIVTGSNQFGIGGYARGSGTATFGGYIGPVRITKGVSRYGYTDIDPVTRFLTFGA